MQLGPQNTAHRIIKPRHGNLARLRLFQRILIEPFPAVRRHIHVEAGINCCGAVFICTPLNFSMAIPVANDETVKSHSPLQHIGQQIFVPMERLTAPA